ncbi:MAG: MFS transporter [Verrucomicrobiales bacterium]|nr:MFS transporter [Verrucomicrobiales bacterium]
MSSPTIPGAAPAEPVSSSAPTRWPSQIKFIIGNEACERFSFYGMKGILAGYITGEVARGALGQSKDRATEWIHLFIMVSYFTPLLGGYLSDRVWGRYRTILWVSLLYCVGHGVLALSEFTASVDAKIGMLGTGMALIALGAGGIKPCVSAFMGDQFLAGQTRLYQKAFGAFYFSVNFGSFFAFLTIPYLARKVGYGWAFGVPGILMGLATLIFWLGTPHYVRVPPARETRAAGLLAVFREAWRNRLPGQDFWGGASPRYSDEEISAARSILPVLSIFILIPPFWAMFDQHSSTWVLQARQMVPFRLTDSYVIGGEEMQSLNPLLVMLLVPLLTGVVYPLGGRHVTPLRRIGVGMFIAGASYVIVAWIQQRLESGATMSVLWQALPYLVLTTAEVLVSTTGLEFAYTQASKSMKSTIMSFWYLTVAAGNGLVALVTRFGGGGSHDASVTPGRFLGYAVLTFVVSLVFVGVAMRYRYRETPAARRAG